MWRGSCLQMLSFGDAVNIPELLAFNTSIQKLKLQCLLIMAEVLATASTIASVFQLIQFSGVILARLDDFHSKTREIPKAFQPLKSQLPVLHESLKATGNALQDNKIDEAIRQALQPTLEDCREQIEALETLLEKILPLNGDSWHQKNKKALFSIHEEKKVKKIFDALDRHVRTLTFYHAASSSTFHLRNGKCRHAASFPASLRLISMRDEYPHSLFS